MNDLIRPVADQFKFNSLILSLATSDLKNEHAGRRFREGQGSSISFLMGHLLSSRYGVLKMLGAGDDNPFAEQFGRNAAPLDVGGYPDISEFKTAWDGLSDRFHAALDRATEDQLLSSVEGYPVDDHTVRGALMFMAWHESYHVGQVGFFRTAQGYPSTERQVHAAMAEK